jgi:hypothetical protein
LSFASLTRFGPLHHPDSFHKIVITGFNTDIEHDGVVYHVQTEDKGLSSPLILSLVYAGGAILASKRSPYQDLIAAGFDEEVLSERLKKQHRLICAAITAGRIEELKRMGARVSPEEKAAPSEGTGWEASKVPDETKALEVYGRIAFETSSERPPATEEPINEMVVETSSERPTVVPEPPDDSEPLAPIPPPEEEVLPRPRVRSKPESAYTVYDSRRKAPMGVPAQSEGGLVLSILDEGEFYAGDPFTIRVLLQNRSGKTEKPVGGVTLSIKILGTGFRPKIFTVKTARDGVGIVSGQIPHFSSGRAAIVIRAVVDERSAEFRKVIHPAA